MATILIVEDDEATRNSIARLLTRAGYRTLSAPDGRLGLAQAARHRPDVVISDVSMPEMDGFELIEAIRTDPVLAATPVILLTALDNRASMRRGMTAGADDYLPKPFAPAELLGALDGLLKKRALIEGSIQAAVEARERELRQGLGGASDAAADRGDAATPGEADRDVDATVLFADIRNFTRLADKLSSSEVAELLTAYFERTCDPVLHNGGRYLKFIGDGLMSIFVDEGKDATQLPSARRAVMAALGMALAAHEFRAWVEQRFGHRELPPFAIGIGLHAGEVTLCRIGAAGHGEITAIGDTVNVAARLDTASKELGWTVVASDAVLRRAGSGIETGSAMSLELRGKNDTVEVVEVTGMVSTLRDLRGRAGTPAERDAEVRDAVRINSHITASAAGSAPAVTVARLAHGTPAD
jgi:class 3 adenylate cyclase